MWVILDTNALIWFADGDDNLGPTSRRLIDQSLWEGELLVSAFSFWEMGMLVAKGRLIMEDTVRSWRQATLEIGVDEIPLSGDIGILSTELEGLPNDPADRIIVATAMTIGATLVTADGKLLRWDGELERQDARQ